MEKYLSTLNSDKMTVIHEPKRNIFLGIALCLIAPVCALIGVSIAGKLGAIVGLLLSVSFVLAGVYQLVGVCETECPYCGEKVYIKRNAKKFKCKKCELISVIQEEQ